MTLALSFFIPGAARLSWWALLRMFASPGTDDSFLPGGGNWILIESLYYGLIGLLIGWASIRRDGLAAVCLVVAALLIACDWLPSNDLWQMTYTNQAIANIGYRISMAHPFVPQDTPLPDQPIPAIPPRTQIDVTTPLGPLRITSGRGSLRTYTWDGVSRSLELLPPDEDGVDGDSQFHTRHFRDRFFAQRQPAYDWPERHGISRGEAWESQRDFENQEQAEAWLAKEQDPTVPLVWTHDGLAIGWSTHVDFKALTIFVWQILIKGKKPDHLSGSDDSRFSVHSLEIRSALSPLSADTPRPAR